MTWNGLPAYANISVSPSAWLLTNMNLKNTEDIKFKCRTENIDVIAQIPFSRTVSESVVSGMPYPEFSHDGITGEIVAMWEKIREGKKALDLL